MALKDWIKTMHLGWTNNKTLLKMRISHMIIYDRWDVLIYNKNWNLVSEFKFKDSIKALSFAKQYMRTH